MAVYKRTYRPYEGGMTPRWSRMFILTRYAARGLFQSKMLTGLFVICFFYPLICIAGLYLNHNMSVLAALKFNGDHFLNIDGKFFMVLMTVQGTLAFLMTAFIGPSLVAPDLANNALPLYFCRPLTRPEYIAGRGFVIFYILSLITWVPGLIVFGVEASLSGASWAWANRSFAFGIVFGFWMWILFLALLALAISAWVRWKLVAGGLLLGVMFVNSGFAAAYNAILRTQNGHYFDPAALITVIWTNQFGLDAEMGISTFSASIALLSICCLLIYILQRKVRAFEVVR